MSGRRAVVVGAGFAGLAAADELVAHGVEVTVFEARERVGGRVHSIRLDNGAVVERGAEFVLPGYDVLRATAKRLGLTLYEKGTLYGAREPRGGPPVDADDLDRGVALLRTAAGGSIADALERLPVSSGARAAIGGRVAVSTAYPLEDQPAEALAEGAAAFGTYASHGVAGGNDAIARRLAERLGSRLALGAPVERIVWRGDGVVVSAGAAEVAADACIVATPAPHALELPFDPPLPDWKQRALAAVRYGHAAKLFLPLAEAAPPSATLSVPARFWTWTQHAPGGGFLPVASSFAGTREALADLAVDEGPARWVEAVRRLRPDLVLAAAAPVLATWHDDEWARGAYSARSLVSSLDEDQLARAVGPIAFAGEHTAGAWHGLMEGALRSGLRAAGEVLAHVGVRERARPSLAAS